jgi:hypothetical protein
VTHTITYATIAAFVAGFVAVFAWWHVSYLPEVRETCLANGGSRLIVSKEVTCYREDGTRVWLKPGEGK